MSLKSSAAIQRAARKDNADRAADSSVDATFVQSALSGQSQPLPNATRAVLEPLFEHNFGDVRVFDNASSHKAAGALHAKAFTVGGDIAFGAGRYAPDSVDGQRLLLHELSHTVQQGRFTTLPDQLAVGDRSDPHERSADRAASSIAAGVKPNLTRASSGPLVQCEDETVTPPPAPVAPELKLDLARLQAAGVLPVGDEGFAKGDIDSVGDANFKLKTPDLGADASMRHFGDFHASAYGKYGDFSARGQVGDSGGPSADGKLKLGETSSLEAHVDPDKQSINYLSDPLELKLAMLDGMPSADGSLKTGGLTGNFHVDPRLATLGLGYQTPDYRLGLDAQLGGVGGSRIAATGSTGPWSAGAGINQSGPYGSLGYQGQNFGLQTQYGPNGFRVAGDGKTNILGQDFTGQAHVDVGRDGKTGFGAGIGAPGLLPWFPQVTPSAGFERTPDGEVVKKLDLGVSF